MKLSLTRRLQLSIALLLALALLINLQLQIRSTRSFLEAQLSSHAQDTATSLALSLSPALAANDEVTAERMIAAVFDRGYYQRILWLDVFGKEKRFWESRPNPVAVPDWFAKILPIKAPESEALLNAGWAQKGSLLVVSNIGYAQVALWQSFVQWLLGSLFAFIALMTLVVLTVRNSLAPLHRMADAANQFIRQKLPMQLPEKIVAELEPLALALTRMSQQVVAQFNAQSEQIADLFQRLHKDEVTQLPNRLALLSALTQREQKSTPYKLIAMRVQNLKEINASGGFLQTNQLLQRFSDELLTMRHMEWYRLSGSEWVALCDTATQAHIAQHAPLRFCVAELSLDGSETISRCLAQIDEALNEAANAPTGKVSRQTHETLSGELWRSHLQRVIEHESFLFAEAHVTDISGELRGVELLPRTRAEDGLLHSAGAIFAQATKWHLTTEVEHAALRSILSCPLPHKHIYLNVSVNSLTQADYFADLVTLAKSYSLAVEMSERELLTHVLPFKVLSELRQNNIGFGLDGVTMSADLLKLLPMLRPDYLKLSLSLTDAGPSSALLNAVVKLGQSLEIEMIATLPSESDSSAWTNASVKGLLLPPIEPA